MGFFDIFRWILTEFSADDEWWQKIISISILGIEFDRNRFEFFNGFFLWLGGGGSLMWLEVRAGGDEGFYNQLLPQIFRKPGEYKSSPEQLQDELLEMNTNFQ